MKNPHVSPEWPGKLYRKIDLYVNGVYFASSNAYKSTAAARKGVAYELKCSEKIVQANYGESK